MHIKDITGEGTVSQNCYIGLGSSRKSRKKIQKVTFPYIYFYIYVYFQNYIYQHIQKNNPFYLMFNALKSHCL